MTQPAISPVVLVILDGWGLGPPSDGNAIELADTPTFDRISRDYPATTLKTSGLDVGLTDGQMGNSEVGHLNLGAGYVVNQTLTRINLAIHDVSFFENPALVNAVKRAVDSGVTLHLMGLLSDGGVHSHIDHLKALLELCARHHAQNVAVHAFLDGRDTSPNGGMTYLAELQQAVVSSGAGHIASIIGRYYAMDRDKRWERTRQAFDLLVSAKGESTTDPLATVQHHYHKEITDEFMSPIVVDDERGLATRITDGDVVILFNFRADRGRQLTQALTGTTPEGSEMPEPPANLHIVTMTEYENGLPVEVAFLPETIEHPLARVISEAGRRQFHSAETEKYAHVTYFFNGGWEAPFRGEERSMIQSPMVSTYDLEPEMSAPGVARAVCDAIRSGDIDFFVMNFANCDMVGHTGILLAAIKATQAVDRELGRVLHTTLEAGGVVLVTADHGNAEEMFVPGTNQPMTAHTTNPVPCVLVSPEGSAYREVTLREGRLADIAPTVLHLMGIDQPEMMTGRSLIVSS
ncbi:2,3-bisphosphoglycerate-independent phosphoglycerate mutase [soil metagenome]